MRVTKTVFSYSCSESVTRMMESMLSPTVGSSSSARVPLSLNITSKFDHDPSFWTIDMIRHLRRLMRLQLAEQAFCRPNDVVDGVAFVQDLKRPMADNAVVAAALE